MKKILKYLLVLIGIIVLLGVFGFLFINVRGIPSYEVETIDYHVELTHARLERGRKLVALLCANCHRNLKTGKLSGTLMKDAPPEFGIVYAPNITQDNDYGIGNWTDGELLYLLRTGILKNGRYSPPWMAKLPHMADEDINSIIAFLKSDDPIVAADNAEDFPCEPSFLTKFLCMVAFKPLKMPKQKIEMPDTTDKVALGKYLAINLECYSCHSSDFKTLNLEKPELSEGFFGGGNMLLDINGEHEMYTTNLTPDKETGIGNWTEAEFVKTVKYGIKEGEPAMRYPMLPYVQFTDYEVKAIFAYLKTVPPIVNKAERSEFR